MSGIQGALTTSPARAIADELGISEDAAAAGLAAAERLGAQSLRAAIAAASEFFRAGERAGELGEAREALQRAMGIEPVRELEPAGLVVPEPRGFSPSAAPDEQLAQVVNLNGEFCDVYIGRPRGGRKGPWGNPFPVRQFGRERAIERYRLRLWEQIRAGNVTLEQLAALHGKRLGCYCAPSACHGDVLARAAAWAVQELARRLAA